MLNENVSVWDNEKTIRKPRTERASSVNTVSVDWDSFKVCRRPRTDDTTRTAVNMAKSAYVQKKIETITDEVVNIDKPDVPGAMSLTTHELREIGLA